MPYSQILVPVRECAFTTLLNTEVFIVLLSIFPEIALWLPEKMNAY